MYVDISDRIELPEGLIDKEEHAFNVPIAVYRAGSYFGDEDVLNEIDMNNLRDNDKKTYRSVTAECTENIEIMALKKRHLVENLWRFREIR